MPFPDGVQTVTVTAGAAGYRTLDGAPYQGTIRLTPSVDRVVSVEHGVIALGPVNISVGASGEFTETVLATDADGFSPTGWTYRVDETFTNAPRRSYSVLLPAAVPSVDLPSLVEVEASDGTVVWAPSDVVASDTVVAETTFGQASTPGVANVYARGDHTHGTPAAPAVGTTAGTVAAGNDARFTDSRTPTAHAASHGSGGSDPVTVAQSQVTGLAAALDARLLTSGGTITGNLSIMRADGQGGYRLRSDGGELDLEIADKDVYISHWSEVDFTGTQTNLLRLEPGGPHLIGRTAFGTGAFDAVHTIDPSSGMAKLGARNGLVNLLLAGRKESAGPPTTGTWDAGDTMQDATGAWWLCTVSGTPGTWTSPTPAGGTWTPADQGLTSWSMDPASCTAAGTTLSAGFIYAVKLLLRQATTLNRVHAVLGSAGAGLTAGQCLAGYYDTAGARLGVTADQSAVWASAGNKAMALTSPVAVPAGAVYAVILFNGTTSPSFASGSTHGATFTPGNAALAAGAYRFCRSGGGQTSLPASVTLASFTPDANNVWAGAS